MQSCSTDVFQGVSSYDIFLYKKVKNTNIKKRKQLLFFDGLSS